MNGEVLAVCGLAFEARLAVGKGVRTLTGGGRSEALARSIESEVSNGIAAIISFGVAGALTGASRPGSLIVAASIIGTSASYPADARWSSALLRRLPHALHGTIAGVDRIVADSAAKTALHALTNAIAVDMESHIAARIAAEHGLPFAALRTIADPLQRSLPPAAMIAMREDGGLDLPAVLMAIARRPQQLPTLLRIGLDTRKALDALGQGRRLLGDRLGYADLDQLLVDVI